MAFVSLRTAKNRFRSEINAIFFAISEISRIFAANQLGMIMCEIIGRKNNNVS